MATKDALQTFQSNWTKAQQYATSRGIHPSAYQPVYQTDAKHLLQYGYGQSVGELTRSISAAAGMNFSTSLPSDNPNPTNILGNAKSNLEQIFTGLNPISLVTDVFDTIKTGIQHPEKLWEPAKDLAIISTPFADNAKRQQAMHDFTDLVLAKNSPWAFVPGAIDAAYAYQGVAGFKHMAETPFTSILDVLPIDRIPLKVLAKTSIGATIAEHAGVHVDEMAAMAPNQLAWKLMKNRPSKVFGIAKLPDGTTTYRHLTNGDRMSAWANSHGWGKIQGELGKDVIVGSEEATKKVTELLQPVMQAMSKLSKDQQLRVTDAVYHDFRSNTSLLNDAKFTPIEKDALTHVFEWERWNTELKMQLGQIMPIKTQFGTELYLIRPGSSGSKLLASKDKAAAAQDVVDKSSHEFDSLLHESMTIQSALGQEVSRFSKVRQNIYQLIKATIPEIDNSKVTESLRATLPEGQKWDRAVLKSDNLETYFGLEPKTVTQVRRDSGYAEPFTGKYVEWSDGERQAWKGAEDWRDAQQSILKNKGVNANIGRAAVKHQAEERLKLMGQLTNKSIHAPVPLAAARILGELVGPGGLAEQLNKAYEEGNWQTLHDLARVMDRKINKNKSFQGADRAESLKQFQADISLFKQFAKHQESLHELGTKLLWGTDRNGKKIRSGKYAFANSLGMKMTRATKAHNDLLRTATENPPDVWANAFNDEYAKQAMATEAGARLADETIAKLKGTGWSDAELTKLREDPRAIIEAAGLAAKASYENPMLPNFSIAESQAISKSAYEEIAKLRAQGLKPRYIPTLTPGDIRAGEGAKPFNVFIGVDHVPTVASSFEKTFGNTDSVYNLQAAMLKDTRQIIGRDATEELINNNIYPLAHARSDLFPILMQQFKTELSTITGADREANVTAFMTQKLRDMNLEVFDPHGIFGTTSARFLSKGKDEVFYLDKDVISGLTQSVDKFQKPLTNAFDKGTNIFRTSILGYSLRFTAHIFFGGGFLLALRSSPDILRFAQAAHHLGHTGKIPDELAAKLGIPTEIHGVTQHSSTQEGTENIKWQHTDSMFHGMSAHQFGKMAADENAAVLMAREGISKAEALLRVIPDMNYRFTRYTTNMHRSLAFLDGVRHANKQKFFYMDEYNSELGKVVRVKKEMTGDQALNEGMKHVDEVMGDLRQMTPIERNVLIRIMPFWGWTKHILKYVMSYPMDHPYRANVLAQLATMNSDNVASGLPMRIELLLFLGHPNAAGNVSAIDVRALNPLRDTANYASLQGWLSALNPMITAPLSQVDPQITFGGNVLYPHLTYNSLYGITEAGPSGSRLSAAEAIVPEISALDTAFNLSGQYGYLRQSGNHAAFVKKLAESLNFPWIEQHLNLRQISAGDEMKRYQQAKAAAAAAWQSGDFSQLAGYGNVPDPRNTQYDISPAALAQIYAQTAKQQPGLPPAAVTLPLKAPTY